MNQQDDSTGGNPSARERSTAAALDHPGVRVPPPLVYLAAILGGVAIDRLVPVRLLSSTMAGWLGGVLILLALAIIGLSFREFRKAKTSVRPDRPASALVTSGPFQYSRNPMYLALALLQAGIGVRLNNMWVVLLVVPTLGWIRRRVVQPEEQYLTARFGQAYLDYQARVRRWL